MGRRLGTDVSSLSIISRLTRNDSSDAWDCLEHQASVTPPRSAVKYISDACVRPMPMTIMRIKTRDKKLMLLSLFSSIPCAKSAETLDMIRDRMNRRKELISEFVTRDKSVRLFPSRKMIIRGAACESDVDLAISRKPRILNKQQLKLPVLSHARIRGLTRRFWGFRGARVGALARPLLESSSQRSRCIVAIEWPPRLMSVHSVLLRLVLLYSAILVSGASRSSR
ncbi:hypothetical protein DBV15_04063 [Temnothorax longispinosus]|uniref:Uncharacterized protein n=1 Tax=Temnothorax longispinosus TaxID=300112 RepID=A0A4S2KCX7_9HYME|nr:hypothetical protein DBV15_04063 [Temnothorax longispinosus]